MFIKMWIFCFLVSRFLVEVRASDPQTHKSTTTETDQKYRMLQGNFNYSQGKRACEISGGKIAVIRNEHENSLAHVATRNNDTSCRTFIILQRCLVYIGYVRQKGDQFHWDGGKSNYSNFDVGEPNNFNSIEDCVVLNYNNVRYRWVDHSCTEKIRVLCEFPRSNKQRPSETQRYKYKMIEGRFTFREGVSKCKHAGFDIAVISNDFENNVASAATTNINGSCETYQIKNKCIAYIGYVRTQNTNQFKWIGRKSNYTQFDRGEPNNAENTEDCVMLNWNPGGWNDVRCTKRASVLCEIPNTSTDQTNSTNKKKTGDIKIEKCGIKVGLESHSGYIDSHTGFGQRKYRTDMHCKWTITGPSNTFVRLYFTTFKVQPSDNCSEDSLSVFEGTDTRGSLLSRMCGHKARDIFSFGPSVTLRFVSDRSDTDEGFRMFYEFEDSVGFSLDLQSEEVHSSFDGAAAAMMTVSFLLLIALFVLGAVSTNLDLQSTSSRLRRLYDVTSNRCRRFLGRMEPPVFNISFRKLLEEEGNSDVEEDVEQQ